MTAALSKTQVDKLGDRLRKGDLSESDLRNLDEYRRSFGQAYDIVVRTLRERLRLKPTGRPAKSTGALVEKLRRESIRLVQVQDIAGCRVVVLNVARQQEAVGATCREFPDAVVVDRRSDPSYGYRAVHVIVGISGKQVEVQVRTALQHKWAELSEKLSDIIDPTIKYGGGDEQIGQMLLSASEAIKAVEELELAVLELRATAKGLPRKDRAPFEERIRASARAMTNAQKNIRGALTRLISMLGKR